MSNDTESRGSDNKEEYKQKRVLGILRYSSNKYNDFISAAVFVIFLLVFYEISKTPEAFAFSYPDLINGILSAIHNALTNIANTVIIKIVIPLSFIVLIVMYVYNVIQKNAREANLLLKDRLLRFFIVLLICLPFYRNESLLTLFPKIVVQESYNFTNRYIAREMESIVSNVSRSIEDPERFKNAFSCQCSEVSASSSGGGGWTTIIRTIGNSIIRGGSGGWGDLLKGFLFGGGSSVGGVQCSYTGFTGDSRYSQGLTGNICGSGGSNHVCRITVMVGEMQKKFMSALSEISKEYFDCVLFIIESIISNISILKAVVFVILMFLILALFTVLGSLPSILVMIASLATAGGIIGGLLLALSALAAGLVLGAVVAGVAGLIITILPLAMMLIIPIMLIFLYQMTFFAYFIKWIMQAMTFMFMFIFSAIQLPFDRGKNNFISTIWSGISIFLSLSFLIITYTVGVVIFVNLITSGFLQHAYQITVTAGMIFDANSPIAYAFELVVRSLIFLFTLPAFFIWPILKIMSFSFQAADMATGGRSFQIN